MSDSKKQLLIVEPKKQLVFEGPVTTIKLTNPLDVAVCFKVKTTVPKRYSVRPNSGILQPNEELTISVVLQPYAMDSSEKGKHKFLIQSMILPEGGVEDVATLFREVPQSETVNTKLICVLKMFDDLVIEPTDELIFEGPFDQPVSSTIRLTNPSSNQISFVVETPAGLSASPYSGMLVPLKKTEVVVTSQPFDFNPAKPPSDNHVTLKVAIESKDSTAEYPQMLEPHSGNFTLKCIYKMPDDSIEPVKSTQSCAVPIETLEAANSEIAALRKENLLLKQTEIRLRRTALSDPCVASGGGVASGALGTIASLPPLIYLLLALLLGLILGKLL